jgi:hypothetical protein
MWHGFVEMPQFNDCLRTREYIKTGLDSEPSNGDNAEGQVKRGWYSDEEK